MSEVAKVGIANEYDCPDCGKLGFASHVKVAEKQYICPPEVTCRHCGAENLTADHPSFEIATNRDAFVWLRMAWQFDCPQCKKLSYCSFVPYRPGIESDDGNVKVEVMEFAPPHEMLCQHCGEESPTNWEAWRDRPSRGS